MAMKTALKVSLALSTALLTANQTHANTITLRDWGGGYQGTADTWLNSSSSYQDNNYGSDVKLEVHYSTVYAAESAIIKFDLSPIPANAVITAASLAMNYGDGDLYLMSNSDWIDLSLWRIKENQSWTEGGGGGGGGRTGASWSYRYAYPDTTGWYNAGALGGSHYDNADATTRVLGINDYGEVDWTGTAMRDTVAAWYANPGSNNGWTLWRSNSYDNSSGVDFFSSEHGSQGPDWMYRPRLIIDYEIPEPATLPLVAMVGLTLARAHRRRDYPHVHAG